jgi:hypothetical protein
MSFKRVIIREIPGCLSGKALVSYAIQLFESTYPQLPHQTILNHAPSRTDPLYHLQHLNGQYVVFSLTEGVLDILSDESISK